MRRSLSNILAIAVFISLFAGALTSVSFAAPADEFEWAFWNSQPLPSANNVEKLNVIGTGREFSYVNAYPATYAHAGQPLGNNSDGQPARNVADDNADKWCSSGGNAVCMPTALTDASITPGANNAVFTLDLGSAKTPTAFALRSADDDFGAGWGRTIARFQVFGSNTNGNTIADWTLLYEVGAPDSLVWSSNYETKIFAFDEGVIPAGGFQYYRLKVTGRNSGEGNGPVTTANGWMQFSYFGMLESYGTTGEDKTTDYLYPQLASGMTTHWAGSRPTMNGPNALLVDGAIAASAAGTVQAKSYTTIRSGLEIQVFENTKLGYMFAPEGSSRTKDSNTYDWKFHSMHMSIDLKFDDGTYLRNLSAADQYGIGLNPVDQGEGKVLKTYQWNYVESEIGKVAAGKVITDILVGFEMDDATPDHKVAGWFDDINIWRDGRDYSAIDPADFVDIRQGANVEGNATGAMYPSVNTTNPMQYMVPTTDGRGSSNRYQWQNSTFYGITTTHTPNRHTGERLSFLFMADSITTSTANSDVQTAVNNAQAKFTHQNEFAYQNYHYGVTFDSNDARAPGVSMEVTPTDNGAVLRFTFPAGATARNIVFEAPQSTTNNYSNMTVSGQTFAAWAQNGADTASSTSGASAFRRKFMCGEFNVAPISSNGFLVPSTQRIRSMARFEDLANGMNGETIIEMRVAFSWISAAQAKRNFAMDMLGKDSDHANGSWEASPTGDNWNASTGDWFEDVKAKAKAEWNEVLSRVTIDDPTANYWQLANFYSKLARSYMYPSILSEMTGNGSQDGWQYASPYRGTNANPVIMDGRMIYNEGWWDTFKSKWPLLGFLTPDAAGQWTNGIIQHYIDQDGQGTSNGTPMAGTGGHSVPRWVNPAGSDAMSGTSSDAVISSMYINGVDIDVLNGYRSWIKNSAVRTTATMYGGRAAQNQTNFVGYRPFDTGNGSYNSNEATWSLEGYENDAAQASMLWKMAENTEELAASFGKTADYLQERFTGEALYYENRAKQYVNSFDAEQGGWFRVKNADGTWYRYQSNAFNPQYWGGGYSEDNAWSYRFLVPQDGNGLANLLGEAQGKPGPQALGETLDSGFYSTGTAMNYPGADYGRYGFIHEVCEKREVKMGEFGLSNQPAYHMPWMYLYSDRPWQTQYWTRTALARAFSGEAIGYGYMGEEDNGAMASWYVWASLGLYPLDTGSGTFVIGSPAFRNISITTDRGKKINITAANNSFDNVYIQSITVDGAPYTKPYLDADMLKLNDPTCELNIVYTMGSVPNMSLFTEQPPSLTEGDGKPEVLIDVIPSDVSIITTPIPTTQTTAVVSLTNMAATSSGLFNNNSNLNYVTFTSGQTGSITYFDPAAPKVEMYTITSGNNRSSDPGAWVFYGSNNGMEWSVLDERAEETFEWTQYVRPFAIDKAKQRHYLYYKLEFTAGGSSATSLAQIEFLAKESSRSVLDTATITGLVAPVKGAVPVSLGDLAVTTGCTVASLVWNPLVSGTFAGDMVYAATIVLEADEDSIFDKDAVASAVGFTGGTSVVSGDGDTLTFTLTFARTESLWDLAAITSPVSKIVAGYAANIPADVTFVGDAFEFELGLYNGDGVLLDTISVSANGRYTFKLDKADAMAGVYAVKAVGADDGHSIDCVAQPDNLWIPDVTVFEKTVTITFASEVTFNASKKGAKIDSAVIDGGKISASGKVVTITEVTAAEGQSLVISGIKYADLFPSYSFTFTLTI